MSNHNCAIKKILPVLIQDLNAFMVWLKSVTFILQLKLSLDDIEAAGIVPGFIEQAITLPPLVLPIPDEEEYKILPKVPSDTETILSSITLDQIRLLDQVIK